MKRANLVVPVLLAIAVAILAALFIPYGRDRHPDLLQPKGQAQFITPQLILAPITREQMLRREPPGKDVVSGPVAVGGGSIIFLVPGAAGMDNPKGYFHTPAISLDRNIASAWIDGIDERMRPARQDAGRKLRQHASDLRANAGESASLSGMNCAPVVVDKLPERRCIAMMPGGEWADVRIAEPRQHSFTTMEVLYFTERYGGLNVNWRAHADHVNRWREIDQALWRSIAERNVSR